MRCARTSLIRLTVRGWHQRLRSDHHRHQLRVRRGWAGRASWAKTDPKKGSESAQRTRNGHKELGAVAHARSIVGRGQNVTRSCGVRIVYRRVRELRPNGGHNLIALSWAAVL